MATDDTAHAPETDTAADLTPPTAPILISVVGGAADQDEYLRAAAAEALPIRVRLQLTVLLGSLHMALPGVRWIADFPSADSVREFYGELNDWVKAWVKARG